MNNKPVTIKNGTITTNCDPFIDRLYKWENRLKPITITDNVIACRKNYGVRNVLKDEVIGMYKSYIQDELSRIDTSTELNGASAVNLYRIKQTIGYELLNYFMGREFYINE